jgi:hypothetical protein
LLQDTVVKFKHAISYILYFFATAESSLLQYILEWKCFEILVANLGSFLQFYQHEYYKHPNIASSPLNMGNTLLKYETEDITPTKNKMSTKMINCQIDKWTFYYSTV